MAKKHVSENGTVTLTLTDDEYLVVRRALAKALVRARELNATADEENLVLLGSCLEPEAWSLWS